jgi:RNA-directed DNA polymerase
VSIERRFAECGLELQLQKARIIYCKGDNRRRDYPAQKFDFLGYTFQPRRSKDRGGRFFIGFSPALSNKAAKSMRETMRQWRMHRQSDKSLDDLARISNPVIRGWINYDGCFYKSALYPIFQTLNNILARWASRKYKRLRGRKRRAHLWLQRIAHDQPCLFAHWQLSQFKAGQ